MYEVKRLRNYFLKYCGFAISFILVALPIQAGDYSNRAEVNAFIERMVTEHRYEKSQLTSLFNQVVFKQSIIDAMSRPAEKVKPWKEYREIFLKEKRIELGAEFWRNNRKTLARAEREMGVPAEIIVAIIGVETYYGRNKGSFRVIDALSTLAFDYPKRGPFFTAELEQFLLLTREQNQSPVDLIGSYAGAMGYGQFMPSSYRHYASDFDGDGFTDIWNNPVDAIGSVANYFKRHGWKSGENVVFRARVRQNRDASVLNKTLKPEYSVAELAERGYTPLQPLAPETNVSPMRLEGRQGPEFWFGLDNFYVITRYNHSRLYAMAVYQLSQRIKQRMNGHATD